MDIGWGQRIIVIDDKGKMWGKINPIDVLFFIFILSGIVAVGAKVMQPEAIQSAKKEVVYSLYNSAEYTFIVKRIKQGDIVKNKENGEIMGEVMSVELKPGKSITIKEDGTMRISTVPNKSSAVITLKTKANVKGAELEKGTVPLLIGSRVEIKGPSYLLETVINYVSFEK